VGRNKNGGQQRRQKSSASDGCETGGQDGPAGKSAARCTSWACFVAEKLALTQAGSNASWISSAGFKGNFFQWEKTMHMNMHMHMLRAI
jgi:hypothetical protein